MDTATIARKLKSHCEARSERQGLRELYAETATSVEPVPGPAGSPISKGLEAIEAKHDWWDEAFEVHSQTVEGPFVHDNRFALVFEVEATEKASGKRMHMREVGLYEVAEGRIVREEFFAPAGAP